MIDERLAEAILTIEEIAKTVSDEVNEHAEGIASQFEDPQRGLPGRQERRQGTEDAIKELGNAAKETFDDLEDGVENLKNAAEEAKNATMDTFADVAENVSDTPTSAADSAYEAFNNGLEQGGERLNGLDTVMNLLTEGFNLFGGESGNIGEAPMQMGLDILTNAASNITDTLMENLTKPSRR